jgi:hypothetical protein
MMTRLCISFLLASFACQCAETPAQILQHIAAQVFKHLQYAKDYICIEAVERDYYLTPETGSGCRGKRKTGSKLFARDRLRLDVAVSSGSEIYSWHAANRFSSSLIEDIVRRGRIASGGFIGFLSDVFTSRGVQFHFLGSEKTAFGDVYRFDYSVPLAASRYKVASSGGSALVPFHGSLSARVSNYELATLTLIADNIPAGIGICSSENDMTYQIAPVAGHDLLLPQIWILDLATPGISTESRSEYSGCKEFAGESVIHYRDLDNAGKAAAQPLLHIETLPAGLLLHVRVLTPLSGHHSFAGDAVEGTLLKPVTPGRGAEPIPSGALLHGVITRIEEHTLPLSYYILDIEFDALQSGNRRFVFHSHPAPDLQTRQDLNWIYGPRVPAVVDSDARAGLFIFTSRHLDTHGDFSGRWITSPLSTAR